MPAARSVLSSQLPRGSRRGGRETALLKVSEEVAGPGHHVPGAGAGRPRGALSAGCAPSAGSETGVQGAQRASQRTQESEHRFCHMLSLEAVRGHGPAPPPSSGGGGEDPTHDVSSVRTHWACSSVTRSHHVTSLQSVAVGLPPRTTRGEGADPHAPENLRGRLAPVDLSPSLSTGVAPGPRVKPRTCARGGPAPHPGACRRAQRRGRHGDPASV